MAIYTYNMSFEPFSVPLTFVTQQPEPHYYITKTWVGSTSLGGGLFGSFADVMNHAAQAGNDVAISYDAANAVMLKNIALANLSANDFLFG